MTTQNRPSRVLIVANRTAATQPLLDAVSERAAAGSAEFHLVVPAAPRGLHRLVDPEVAGRTEAATQLELALEKLRAETGAPVTGHVGDADPLAAISDAMHEQGFDEIIISTLSRRLSRWMHMDLPSKARFLGLPVLHVSPDRPPVEVKRAA